MNTKELSDILSVNINRLNNINFYKSVINLNNNLFKFNIINRIIISIQNNKAYDLRLIEEWKHSNIIIKSNSKPVYTLVNKIETKYIDNETLEEINTNEVSNEEIELAIKYNIIDKVTEQSELSILALYDISQANNKIDGIKYNRINMTDILDIASELLMCDCRSYRDTFYNKDKNMLYVNNKNFEEKIVDILVDNLYCYGCSDLVTKTLKYSINSLFQFKEKEIDFSLVNKLSADIVLKELMDYETKIEKILNVYADVLKIKDIDIVRKNNIHTRAENLLTILESTYAKHTISQIIN